MRNEIKVNDKKIQRRTKRLTTILINVNGDENCKKEEYNVEKRVDLKENRANTREHHFYLGKSDVRNNFDVYSVQNNSEISLEGETCCTEEKQLPVKFLITHFSKESCHQYKNDETENEILNIKSQKLVSQNIFKLRDILN